VTVREQHILRDTVVVVDHGIGSKPSQHPDPATVEQAADCLDADCSLGHQRLEDVRHL
jgi:hypothetical protein